ncbi:MAG: flippase [Psychroflexus sp.]|nr:flippase [Psychroflexus sp.]MDN6309746.1 flippase [Psychroflexus sp.]
MKKRIQKILGDTDQKEILSKGFSFLGFSATGLLAGYLFTLFIARVFGASVNGLVALSFSILMMVSMLGRLGIDLNLVKYYADDDNFKNDSGLFLKVWAKALVFSSVLGLLVFLFRSEIAIYLFDKPQLIPYIKWTAPAIPLWVSVLLSASVFRARKNNKTYSFLDKTGRFVLALIILLILYYFSQDPIITMKAHFYGTLILAIFSFIATLKSFESIKIIPKQNSWQFLKESFPMMLSSTILVFLGWIDTFILGMFETDDVVGVYSIALKVATLTSFSLQAINSILAPKIAAAYKQDEMEKFKKLIKFSTKLNFFTTIIVVAIIIVFHQWILEFFGKEFIAGATVLILLCIGQLVNSISGSVGVILQMTGHQRKYRNIVFLALIVNVVLNISLTPFYGAIGIAISTVVSMALWNIIGAIYLKRKMNVITYYNFS